MHSRIHIFVLNMLCFQNPDTSVHSTYAMTYSEGQFSFLEKKTQGYILDVGVLLPVVWLLADW